jgi:hypothetical protein
MLIECAYELDWLKYYACHHELRSDIDAYIPIQRLVANH